MLEVIFWICVRSSFSFVLDSYICSRLFSLVLLASWLSFLSAYWLLLFYMC